MRTVKTLINKELKITFNSILIYIALIVFFGVTGFICWFSWSNIFSIGLVPLSYLFNIFYWALFFLIPFLTMKSIAEERKVGTYELLLSKPITTWQIIWGKFCAILLQVVLCLVLTLSYYITLAYLGHIDHAVGICGYIGLILVSSCYISIGMFASSLTSNPLFAFFISIGVGLCFQKLFEWIAELFGTGLLTNIFHYFAMGEHFDSFSRGIIDTKDIIYFFSIIILFLNLTKYVMNKSRIQPKKNN